MKNKTSQFFPPVNFFLNHPLHSHFLKHLIFSASFYEDGRLRSLKIEKHQAPHRSKIDGENDAKKYFDKKIRHRFAVLKKVLNGYFRGDLKILEEVYDWLDFANCTATPLQKRVWSTMLDKEDFAVGRISSYENLAKSSVGHLKNKSDNKSLPTRAVASAVAKNPFFILVPCHRIVPKHAIEKSKKLKGLHPAKIIEAMDVGQYGSGAFLKKQLLLHEAKAAPF